MKFKNFTIALDSGDFTVPNEIGAEFPFKILSIVSDFRFLTNYFSNYISKHLQKQKIELKNFDKIIIRARKNPIEGIIYKEHFKAIEIEMPFNEDLYKEIYPFDNKYPITDLLMSLEEIDKFNIFLVDMVLNGIEIVIAQAAEIPSEAIKRSINDFILIGFKNEWVDQIRFFKEHKIKAILFCRLTANHFSLELIIEKNSRESFRKEILRTLPSEIMYQHEFTTMKIENGILFIINNDEVVLFELELENV